MNSNSNLNETINKNIYNFNSNKKKGKLYKVEKTGNIRKLQEFSSSNLFDIGGGLFSKNNIIKKNDESSHRGSHITNKNVIQNLNKNAFFKCPLNSAKERENNSIKHVNKPKDTFNFKNGYFYKNHCSNNNIRGIVNYKRINSNQKRDIIDFKTTATTKVTVDELRSMQSKKSSNDFKRNGMKKRLSNKVNDLALTNLE